MRNWVYLKTQNNLKDICDNYLIYLLDNGFVNIINKTTIKPVWYPDDTHSFTFKRDTTGAFSWDSIKDSFIPFLHFISKDFTIEDIKIHTLRQDFNNLTVNDLIEDNVDLFKTPHQKGDLDLGSRAEWRKSFNYSDSLLTINFNILNIKPKGK